MEGVCFSIRIAVIGPSGVGKTTTCRRLQQVPNFDKLFNGYPAPVLAVFPSVTDFVDYVPLETVVNGCPNAASHRVYLMDTPGAPLKEVLYRSLIAKQGGSIAGGVEGAIIMCDATAPHYEVTLLQHIRDCAAASCRMIVVHQGGPVGASLAPHLDGVPFICVDKWTDDGLVEIAKALVSFVQLLHDESSSNKKYLRRQKEELDAAELFRAQQKHPRPLPDRKIDYKLVIPAPPLEDGCSLRIALLGGPNTGKTSFLSGTLDGFILPFHEPTTQLEYGTAFLNFADAFAGKTVLTFVDGIHSSDELVKAKCCAAILFVDVSSPFGLDEALRIVKEMKLPTHVLVLGTKSDVGTLVSYDALYSLAGSIQAFLELTDCRKSNEPLLVKFVCGMRDQEQRNRMQFELAAASKAAVPREPSSENDVAALFNLFDTQQKGYITVQEARSLFDRCNHTGFGDFDESLARVSTRHRALARDGIVNADMLGIILCRLTSL